MRPVLVTGLSVASVFTVAIATPALSSAAPGGAARAGNSSLDWKAQYSYIRDIGDGRGYTAGIIGFCSGTGDMLELARAYTNAEPDNPLAQYLPALEKVNGSDSHEGLGSAFESAWKAAAGTSEFQAAQDSERDRGYFDPAVNQGKSDGLGALGQFSYYDAIVMHGPGDSSDSSDSFGGIPNSAIQQAKPPSQGGDETTYLKAFLDARNVVMKQEEAHADTSRVHTEQLVFLNDGNLDLHTPAEVAGLRRPVRDQLTPRKARSYQFDRKQADTDRSRIACRNRFRRDCRRIGNELHSTPLGPSASGCHP